jgi:uncharacterized membrane protein YfcA
VSLALYIVVASTTLYLFDSHISLRISIPLLISIPFAFIDGSAIIPEKLLVLIFVISHFSASVMLLLSGSQIKIRHEKIRKLNPSLTMLSLITLPLGAILGTVSGLVGIGGGLAIVNLDTDWSSKSKDSCGFSKFVYTHKFG